MRNRQSSTEFSNNKDLSQSSQRTIKNSKKMANNNNDTLTVVNLTPYNPNALLTSPRSWRHPDDTITLLRFSGNKHRGKVLQRPERQQEFQFEFGDSSDSSTDSECSYEEFDLRDFGLGHNREHILQGSQTDSTEAGDGIAFEQYHPNCPTIDLEGLEIRNGAQVDQRQIDLQRTLLGSEMERMLQRVRIKDELKSIIELQDRSIHKTGSFCAFEEEARNSKNKLNGKNRSFCC